MRVFGGDRLKSVLNTLKVDEDQPIQAGIISKAIEKAQIRVEGFNFDGRKHILEYDNAYRFRVVDLMEKMTKEDFLNPRKAIQKLKNISREREGGEINIASKKDKILTLVQLATFVPKIRRAIIKVTQGMNLSNLQSQEHHHYWFCLPQYAYQFMGMTNEQRKEYREKKGWTYPEGMVNSH